MRNAEKAPDKTDRRLKALESKNKFWKGILIGSLVTAFAGLVIVGMSAGIFLIGRSMIRSQVQAQNGSPAGRRIMAPASAGMKWR